MEIRPDSWHWKLYKRYMQNTVSVSLCEYFWSVVFCVPIRVSEFIFSKPFRPLTIAVLIVGFVVIPLSYLVMGTMMVSMIADGPFFDWILLLAFLELLVICVGLLKLAKEYLIEPLFYVFVHVVGENCQKIRERDTYQLLKAYLKAKKDKVCPMLVLPNE